MKKEIDPSAVSSHALAVLCEALSSVPIPPLQKVRSYHKQSSRS